MATLMLSIRLAWWLRLYLRGLAFFCSLHGTEPNQDRLRWWFRKGVTIRAVPVERKG